MIYLAVTLKLSLPEEFKIKGIKKWAISLNNTVMNLMGGTVELLNIKELKK